MSTIIETIAYTAAELETAFPASYAATLQRWQDQQYADGSPWDGETVNSLRAVISAAGFTLQDWSLGTGSYTYLRLAMHDAEDLQGARAMAWWESNVVAPMRVPWTGRERTEARRYGISPGTVPACPLTGYCADDEYLAHVARRLRAGDTISAALLSLDEPCVAMMQADLDQAVSEDAFREHCATHDARFDASGYEL